MLKGQTAIITGSARGFGLATAEIMASEGANIVILDILDEKIIQDAVAKVMAKGVKAIGLRCDVSKYDQCQVVVEKAKEAFGHVDILVNNAGVLRDDLTLRMKEEAWDLVIDVNLKGVFNMTKAVVKLMNKAKKGKIVNISSVTGVIGNPGQANYAASKAGVLGLTKTWAREFSGRNINVNAIAPGLVITDMTSSLSDEQQQTLIKQVPLGRLGSIEDIANAIVFLASPKADYITGVVLRVDGGMATGC